MDDMNHWTYSITFATDIECGNQIFEPWIAEPFPNEKLLRKKKINATEGTIFHWEMALLFTVQNLMCGIS